MNPVGRRPRAWRRLRRFRRDESGLTVVEFGLVALPFFMLTFAIIETGLTFLNSQMLETAVEDSARLLMTGQQQIANKTAADFKAQVCAKLVLSFDCSSNIQVDVRTWSAFASADTSMPISNGLIYWSPSGSPQYNPGTANSIVVVRVILPMPTFTNLFGNAYGKDFANLANGTQLLMATAAFKNEPWPTS